MAEQGPLQAFRTEVVVDGFPRKIETLCLWGEQLLAGLQEGSLLFFKRLSAQPPASTPSGGADAQPDTTASWQVVDAHRDVERKAVLQMLAISVSDHTLSPMPSFAPLKASASGGSLDGKAQQQQQQQQQLQQQQKQQQQPAEDVQGPRASQLLLSLTVDGVNVHSLPNARLRCQGLRTKGATCFAWHAPTRTVAVAVKKRLLLFKLVVSEGRKGGGVSKGSVDLEEAADLAMPEAMNTITFAGPHLFLGSRKQYYLMANVLSALAPTPSPSAPAAETAAAASAAKAAAAALTAVSVGSVGTALAPAIAVCPSVEEVLLACDNMAAFVSFSGAPSRRSSLAFKEPLQALVATDFYVVGLMAAGAEVHSLRRTGDATVSQFMPELQGARLVALPGMSPVDGSIFAAMSGDRGIRRLVPIPLETQAELLATAGEYQEALALAALAASRTPAQSQRQQQEERPRALLTSPQGSWHPVVSETSEDQSQQGGGTNILEDRLRLLYGNHLFASGAWDEGAAQLALCSGRVTGMTGAPLLLLRLLPSLVPESWRTALPDHAAGTPLLKVTEPTGPSFAAAAATLLPYLMSYRTRIIAALQASQSGGNASTTSTTNSSKSVDSPRAAANGTQGSEVAEACIRTLSIIDVAVVAILLAQPEDTGALLRFVQQPRHWIDLEEGEKLLTSSGYYAELAALYKHYSKHKQGLELLYRTSQRPETLNPPARGAAADLPGLPGVWATVRYLVKLGGMNREEAIPLIKRHAKWVLEADPDAGLQAFLEMQPPLDPSTVLSILHQHSPHYCSMYLEAALQLGVALPQDYHSELLLIYLQEILSKDEDALQTLKGPYGSSQELTEEEASSSGEDAESYGNGTASEQISISKWARSKSAAVRTNTDLLFPLDHSQQSKRTNPISIAPRQGVNSRISYDADHGGKPRSLNALEAMKAGQQAPGPSRFDGGGLPPLPSRHTFDPPQQGEGGFVGAVQGMGNSVRRGGGAGGLVSGEGGPDGSERGLREGGLSVGLRGAAQAHGAAVSGSQSSAVGTGAGGVLSHHRYHQRTPSDPMPGAFELRPPAQSGGAPAGAAGVSGRQGGGVTGGEGVQGGQQGEMHGQQLMLGQQFEQGSQQQENGQQQLRPFHEAQRGMAQSESGRARSRRRRGVRRLDSGYALGYSSLTGPPPSLYERLRHLVYTSPYIDPDYVLTKLPPGQLPEIRALMLERLRRHREAISLYVHDLHSLSAAEAYCDRVYLQEQAQLPPHLRSLSQSSLAGVIKGGAPTTAAQPAPVGPSFDPASTHTLLRKPADIYLMLLQVVLAGTFYQPVDPAVSISQLPSLQLPTLEQGNSQQQPQQQPPQQQQQQQQQQEKHQQQQEGSRRGANEGEQGANAANAKKRREGGADKDGHGPLTLDERTWMQLAWILSRKCGRLDPLEVLDALPEDVPLAYVMPWLGAALGHCTEQSRNLAVVKHLRRSESLNLREAVGRAKQGHVHVSSERICCLCYKRIGPAVFVAYPDRTLAHYVCHQRREKGKGNK